MFSKGIPVLKGKTLIMTLLASTKGAQEFMDVFISISLTHL